jgi:hypothetical protein
VNPKSALLVTLLAAGFAYQPASPTAPPSAGGKTQAPLAAGRTVTYDKQLQEKNWPLDAIEKATATCPSPRACELRFVIATVPDPKNSPYTLQFDRMLESIQLGAGESGYSLERFWLPWDSEPVPPDSDFLLHQQHQDWLSRLEENPGVLIFRANKPTLPARLCIFIVAENPVTGINRVEFRNAVAMVPDLNRSAIKILGPAFSGSVTSLGLSIADEQLAQDSQHKLSVVTGTATAVKGPGNKNVTYRRLIGDDQLAIQTFLAYATKKTSCDHLAFLSEAGTAYASSIREFQPKEFCGASQIRNIEYPMQISRMRNAYANDPDLTALSQTKVANPQQQGLEIPLKDEHDSQDIIPTFSTELRPVAQEASILNVLATMSRSRIEYVGIVATDVLDALFIGRLLKQHCPNIRPFILDADLIFGHVSQNNAFDGMLMATDYPLFHIPGVQNPHQFSSATQEGEYRAALQVVAEATGQRPPGFTFDDAPHINVMGRDGIWPITSAENFRGASPSGGWRLVFSLVSLFCLGFAGAIVYHTLDYSKQRARDTKSAPHLRWLSALLTCASDTRITLTLACSVLLAFYALLTGLELQARDLLSLDGGVRVVVCLFTLATLMTAILCCWIQIRPLHVALMFAASGILCAALSVPTFQSAFVYRSLHISNGVSPVVPLLFLTAALFWMAYTHLNRIRLLKLFPKKSLALTNDSYLSSAETLRDDLFGILDHWGTGKLKWPVMLGFVLLFSLVILNPIHIFSLETFRFEWIYCVALYALYFGLLMECTRFLRGWSTLQNLLRKLEHHVLCETFRRLPDELAPSYLWRFGNGGPSLLVVAHFLNRLKRLADRQLLKCSDSYYDNKLNDIRQYARNLMAGDHASPRIDINSLDSMNTHIEEVFSRLVMVASHSWGSIGAIEKVLAAGVGETAPVEVQPADSISPLAAGTHHLAEEMIALRFVEVIAQVNLHLKNNLEFITGGLILAVISLNSYPFEPHRSMTSMLTIYFFAMGAVFVTVFMQMSRNTIISYMSRTEPGKLDSSVLHVLSFGGLPLLAVISSQFPSIGGFLFAWVKPALESLR